MNKTNHLSSDGMDCGKYPFFTNENNSKKFLNSFDFDGEYVICNTGGKANFKYFNGKFSCMSDCLVIKTNGYSTKKLYYYLQNKTSFIDNLYFKGSGLKHLDIKQFKKMKVFNCAEHEYQLMDSISKKIDIEKKYLLNLRNQKRYFLNNLFI